jgi:hypothetical protein
MDLNSVKPYTETELQPIYSSLWLPYIEQLCDKILAFPPGDLSLRDLLINKSVIRSMLVMDLMDCAFTNNKALAEKIFKAYTYVMCGIYLRDPFSTEVNIHGIIPLDWRDTVKTGNFGNNPINKKILHWCYNLSYKQWQDIYADNTYEIVGPYNFQRYTYIFQDFREIKNLGHVQVISRYDQINIYDIKIDMFGHCDYKLHEPIDAVNEMILLNGKEIGLVELESKLEYEYMLLDTCMEGPRMKNFSSRYFRYKGLFKFFNISVDTNTIREIIHKGEKQKRLNVSEIKELLNSLL